MPQTHQKLVQSSWFPIEKAWKEPLQIWPFFCYTLLCYNSLFLFPSLVSKRFPQVIPSHFTINPNVSFPVSSPEPCLSFGHPPLRLESSGRASNDRTGTRDSSSPYSSTGSLDSTSYPYPFPSYPLLVPYCGTSSVYKLLSFPVTGAQLEQVPWD